MSTGRKILIKSKITVSSGGSLHSPALLLRSKVPNSNVGKNLRLHPVVTVAGLTDEDNTQPYGGCIMSWYSDQAGNRDGKHYGAKLETPSAHPGTYAVALSWNSPSFYKTTTLGYNNSVFGIVLCRDRDSGVVTIDEKGAPVVHYPLSKFDREVGDFVSSIFVFFHASSSSSFYSFFCLL